MLKKLLSVLLLCAILVMVGLESSFIPLHREMCDKAKDAASENCTTYNFASYALWKTVGFLDSINTVITAISTFAVAVFTYTLARSTKQLFVVTKTAADAANLSARAAIAIELPIIRVEPVGFGWGSSRENDEPEIEYFGLQCFDFSNLGRTKAFPIEIRWGWTVGDSLPDIPVYNFSKSFGIDVIFEPDSETRFQLYATDFAMNIAPGDTGRIMGNQIKLWLYCCVVYLDFMQTRHEVGFCWKRLETFGGGRLLVDATSAYNCKT
jgi:hypothetical protein